jgi:DNA-binding GntR family transcriptional regulator
MSNNTGPVADLRLADRKTGPYEKIKQAIVSGELAQGQPLVELALAEWCGVSRTPIREALTRLEQDGLAQRAERGLVVRENSPEEILDLYETRIVLESMAASVAAERRTSHDLLHMRREAERTRPQADIDSAVEHNRTFHRAVWRASHNDALQDLLERLNLHLGRYPATTLSRPGRLEVAYEQHRQMIQAIADRNSDEAARIAALHFSEARDIRLELWNSE